MSFGFQNGGCIRGYEGWEEVVKWVNDLSKSSLMRLCNGMLLILKNQDFILALLFPDSPIRDYDQPLFFSPSFFLGDQRTQLRCLFKEKNLCGRA